MAEQLCHWCDRPAADHPRYIALRGVHDWAPPRRLSDPAVPHPLGGITYPADPSRAAQWWEDTDPDPAPPPGGGDRLPNSTYNRKATT